MTQNSLPKLRAPLRFHKLQGAGNDFVVLDLFAAALPADFSFESAAKALCDRHFGSGGDGLLTLEPAVDGTQVRMRMWNPDGSEDMCGNGLRCVALLAWRQRRVAARAFRVQTIAGARRVEILENGLICTEMGAPIFEPVLIPIAIEAPNALDIEIPLPDRTFTASSLSTGSTHTVIFLEAPLSEADFQRFGPLLEHHPLFPTRTSVMFAVPNGPNCFQIRIWERGAGETLACGTGACAVAVAAQMTARAGGAIEIVSKGGVLKVNWQPGEPIFLTGPAKMVFEATGEFEIESHF